MTQKYQAKVVEDSSSESGLSLVFPEGVLEELGWKEGDELKWSVFPEGVVLEKVVSQNQENESVKISFDNHK